MQVPVRCMLDRDEDMMLSGTRHPFYTKYKVAFTKEGKLTGSEVQLYCNAGYSSDLSPAVSTTIFNLPIVAPKSNMFDSK